MVLKLVELVNRLAVDEIATSLLPPLLKWTILVLASHDGVAG